MALITVNKNKALTGIIAYSDAIQMQSNNAVIEMRYTIPTNVSAELQVSTDGVNFSAIEGSGYIVQSTKSQHTWIVSNMQKGVYIRVAIDAITGTINQINFSL